MSNFAVGIDTSQWETAVWNPATGKHDYQADFGAAVEQGFKFIVFKASQVSYYGRKLAVDPAFIQSRNDIIATGVPSAPYHLLDPRSHVSAMDQARQFVSLVCEWKEGKWNYPYKLPPVLDVEITWGATMRAVAKATQEWVETVHEVIHIKPIIYTSAGFWNSLPRCKWAKQYKLWVANYKVDKPKLPRDWDDWTFWQYSDKGIVPGLLGDADMDYYHGTYDEMLYEFGIEDSGTPPAVIERYKVIKESLFVRNKPDVSGNPVGNGLRLGDVVVAYESKLDRYGNLWIRIDSTFQNWSCVMWCGMALMEIV
jgi:GH25 family lysozyme M1 (1,4-beta-N-acetylmuramidase)